MRTMLSLAYYALESVMIVNVIYSTKYISCYSKKISPVGKDATGLANKNYFCGHFLEKLT